MREAESMLGLLIHLAKIGVFELTVYVLSVTSNNDNATYNICLGVTCKEFSKCLVHCKFSVVYL